MGSFATLSLNRILGLADVEAVERFRDEFPHLYLPREAYFLDGHHTVFKEISINLIVQHWLVANTFVYADNLKNELRGKEDDLFEAIRQGHGSPNSREFEAARVDPEFAKVRDQFVSKARNEAEADEEFEPEVDGEMGIIYHKVMDLAETTIQIYEDENMIRAFGGLSRELNRSLKLVKKGFQEAPPDREWVTVNRYPGESEFIHSLREFEANSTTLDTAPFRQKQSHFTTLRRIRNEAEHPPEISKSDEQDLTEDSLLNYFDEARKLFELLEQDPVFGVDQ
jgi:hypothetical protein